MKLITKILIMGLVNLVFTFSLFIILQGDLIKFISIWGIYFFGILFGACFGHYVEEIERERLKNIKKEIKNERSI